MNVLDIPSARESDSLEITSTLLVDIVIPLKAYWLELNDKNKRTKERIESVLAKRIRLGRETKHIDERLFRKEADRSI